jgi:hypothetical protein
MKNLNELLTGKVIGCAIEVHKQSRSRLVRICLSNMLDRRVGYGRVFKLEHKFQFQSTTRANNLIKNLLQTF